MKTINLSFGQVSIMVVACVILGMISVGYVAAQTASSTEEAATSTTSVEPVVEPVAEPEAAVLGEATTTVEAETPAPNVEEEVEEAPPAEEETPEEAASQVSATAAAVEEIAALEQDYMSKYGRYLQVMPGNTLPSTESGSVQSKFGKALPENVRIDVYQSPHGKGYQISYEEDGVVHSVGYGPEAADRTYTIEHPVILSATSTTQ